MSNDKAAATFAGFAQELKTVFSGVYEVLQRTQEIFDPAYAEVMENQRQIELTESLGQVHCINDPAIGLHGAVCEIDSCPRCGAVV